MKLKCALEENLDQSGCRSCFLDINTLKQMPLYFWKHTKDQQIYFDVRNGTELCILSCLDYIYKRWYCKYNEINNRLLYIPHPWLTYKKKILNKSFIQIYDHICYSKSSCLSGNDLYKKSERMKEMCRKLGYFANPVFGFSNEENTFLSIKTSRLAKWHIKVPYPKTSKLKEFRLCVSIFSFVS